MNKDEASFGIPSEPCLGEVLGGGRECTYVIISLLKVSFQDFYSILR